MVMEARAPLHVTLMLSLRSHYHHTTLYITNDTKVVHACIQRGNTLACHVHERGDGWMLHSFSPLLHPCPPPFRCRARLHPLRSVVPLAVCYAPLLSASRSTPSPSFVGDVLVLMRFAPLASLSGPVPGSMNLGEV